MFEHKQSIITRCPISNVSGFDEKEVIINQKAAVQLSLCSLMMEVKSWRKVE
jgi:hypothetical protein